jgi:predicted lipoprotein
MSRVIVVMLGAVAALGLSGCKIVKKSEKEGDEKVIAADASGDDARNEIRMEETFEAKLLPHIRDNALALQDLRSAVGGNLDDAGEAHGNRGAGRGAAWNFPVRGEGVVVDAKLDTRARRAEVDTDGDSEPDMTLQLGPVIRGTALRDVAPFFKFDDFRDQIEFAKLGRAINDRIAGMITVPEGDLIGQSVSFIGVVPLKAADDAYQVTPIEVGIAE